MDLTREALKYVAELGTAEVININGENYTDKQVYRVNQALRADPVKMSTLTSLLDYLKADVDTMPEKMIVQVESPTCVRVLSRLDMDRKREELAVTHAELPDFDYGRYMGKEKFIITLQAVFLQNEDRELLLRFAGTVKDETIAEYGDNGISQKATIKTGITTVGEAVVPNVPHLYRGNAA